MKKLDIRLLRFLKEMKGQVIATISILVVGIMLYTSLNSAAINLERTLKAYYSKTNFAHLTVDLVKISKSKVNELNKRAEIKLIEGRIVEEVPLKVKKGEQDATVRIISYDPKEKINRIHLVKGNLGDSHRDIVVLRKFAMERGLEIGDSISLQINGKEYKFRISGLTFSPEYVYLLEDEQSLLPAKGGFGVAFLNKEFLENALSMKNEYNNLVVVLNDERDENIVKDILEDDLDDFGLKRVIKREYQLSNNVISEEIEGLKKSSNSVPIIFLIISAIIIMTIIKRMIAKDRVTIGILKSLGYSNRDIILHYIKFSLLIGVLASIIGSLGGLFLAKSLMDMYRWFYNLPDLGGSNYYIYIVIGVVLASVLTILAGYLGARKITKILPSSSMRPEAPKIGKRIFLEKYEKLWGRVSFSWKIVVRNIFRNKKRFITVTMGVAITYMITLFPYYQMKIFNSIFINHFRGFQKMDYNINFSKPLGESSIVDLKNIYKGNYIEGKIEYPFEIKNGWKSKVVTVIGLEEGSKFYIFKNLKEEEISIPKRGLTITENLAKILGVRVGEKVEINNFIPGKDDTELVISEIIRQDLGMNGYINKKEMEERLINRNMVTGAYVLGDIDKTLIEDGRNIASIDSSKEMIEAFKEFLKLTISSVVILLVFAGILGFGIIYNATIINISERTSEFSTLQVLGFTKREIFLMIFKETILMTILGIIIGYPMSIWLLNYAMESFNNELFTLSGKVGAELHLFTIASTLIFITIAQLFTFRKINRLNLIEVLKNRIS